MSTLKKIRKDLESKGARNEDIEMALAVLVRLEAIDRMVFPKNTAIINFSIGKGRFGHPIGHNKRKAKYNIYLDGLANFFQEEKRKKCLWIPKRPKSLLLRATQEELLISIAAHEVRHRVQSDCSIKKFSSKNVDLIKDKLLRAVVRFNILEFEEREKIYIRDKESKAFIKDRINRREFDASVIERLVAIKVHQKNVYNLREEIISTIRLEAP